MESILLALSPIVVAGLTQLSKKGLNLAASINPLYLRIIVGVFSVLAAIGNGAASGDLDVMSIHTLADAIVAFLGATGAYYLAKRKE